MDNGYVRSRARAQLRELKLLPFSQVKVEKKDKKFECLADFVHTTR